MPKDRIVDYNTYEYFINSSGNEPQWSDHQCDANPLQGIMTTDQVSLLFDWGDGSSSGWIGPYNSGEDVTIAHIYSGFSEKSFEIKVKAKDIYGKIGEWSDPLPVTMPFEYKSILNLWDVLFERFPYAFPLLRQLME